MKPWINTFNSFSEMWNFFSKKPQIVATDEVSENQLQLKLFKTRILKVSMESPHSTLVLCVYEGGEVYYVVLFKEVDGQDDKKTIHIVNKKQL